MDLVFLNLHVLLVVVATVAYSVLPFHSPSAEAERRSQSTPAAETVRIFRL